MNNVVRDRLDELVSSYGAMLQSTPRMCEVLIRQKCADYPAEAELLVQAMQRGTVKELESFRDMQSWDRVSASLAAELSNGGSISSEDAYWAVESWALAMRKHPHSVMEVEPDPYSAESLYPKQKEEPVMNLVSQLLGTVACGALGGAIGPVLYLGIALVFFVAVAEAITGDSQTPTAFAILLAAFFALLGGVGGAIGGALGGYACVKFAGTKGALSLSGCIGALMGAACGGAVATYFCGAFGATLGALIGGWLGAFSQGMRGGLTNRWN